MKRLLIFGFGYTAKAVAARLAVRDIAITGTLRSVEASPRPASDGAKLLAYDGGAVSSVVQEALFEATHLLVSIPPGGEGEPFLRHAADVLRKADRLQWIGYLSTVGVYGDHRGAWVDETSELRAVSVRSKQRVAAEAAWTEAAGRLGVPLAIFRLAGIYGPGRNAFVNLAAGKAHRIVKAGQVFNRIHVADIASVVASALEGKIGGAFNIADDEPAPPQDVVTEAARLMDVAPPPEQLFETAELSPMARSFYGENKRVSNARMKELPGVMLQYPNYRAGLAALWKDGNWRG